MNFFKLNFVFKLISYFILFFYSLASHAAIYKCVENGRSTFSEFPCADDAQAVEIKSQKRLINDKKNSVADANDKVEAFANVMQASRLKRQYNREIKSNNKNIKAFTQAMNAELRTVKNKIRSSRSVFSPKDYENKRALKIEIIKTKYKSKISQAKNNNKKLKQSLRNL